MLGRLGDDSILTMGASSPNLGDVEQAWRRELGAQPPCSACTGVGEVAVVAYCITVVNAAAADKGGLIQLSLSAGLHPADEPVEPLQLPF